METIKCWVSIQSGKIRVLPDPIQVPFGKKVKILWKLRTPGWKFATADGIDIHHTNGPFSGPTPMGTTFSWVNNNTRRAASWRGRGRVKVFRYFVNLVPQRGKAKTLDPAIENENS
jgi:hypothetical protein